jgi:hypothetical protein
MLSWPGWSARWLAKSGRWGRLICHEVRFTERKENSLHFDVIH